MKRRKHTHAWLLRHKNYTFGKSSYPQMLENAVMRELAAEQSETAEVDEVEAFSN